MRPRIVLFATLAAAAMALGGCEEENAPPAGNQAPSASAGDNQAVETGDTVQLDGSGSVDPDGDPLTFLWSLESLPGGSGAALTADSLAVTSFVTDAAGEYVVSLTVSDGQAGAVDTVRVTAATPAPSSQILIAADREGEIYAVDPATGADTLLLDTFISVTRGGGDVGVISAMIYDPVRDELLAGTGGEAVCEGCISIVETATGETDTLWDLSVDLHAVPDLAIRPADGVFLVHEADGSGLYGIDPMTGVVAEINPATPDQSGNGLTFAVDGTLYLASNEDLYTVDPVTGDATLVASCTYTGFPAFVGASQTIGSLTTRAEDGTVFGILKDGGGVGGGGPTFLVTVNLATAEITHVGQNTQKLDGLAFVPSSLFP